MTIFFINIIMDEYGSKSITFRFYRGSRSSFRSWDWIWNDSSLRGFTSCPNSGHVKESFVFTSRCRLRSAAARSSLLSITLISGALWRNRLMMPAECVVTFLVASRKIWVLSSVRRETYARHRKATNVRTRSGWLESATMSGMTICQNTRYISDIFHRILSVTRSND